MIYKKMLAIMSDISAIGKNEKNRVQGFNFRGIDAVYNELHNLMAKHGVFSTPEVMADSYTERQSKNGGNLIFRILTIKYTFYAEDGSNVQCTVIGEGMDSADKAASKAMSIAHKYALTQVFCIPTKEQKDPDYESHPDSVPVKPDTKLVDEWYTSFLGCETITDLQEAFPAAIKSATTTMSKAAIVIAKDIRKKELA